MRFAPSLMLLAAAPSSIIYVRGVDGDFDVEDVSCLSPEPRGAVQVDSSGSGDIALGNVDVLEPHVTGAGEFESAGRPMVLRTEVEGSGSILSR